MLIIDSILKHLKFRLGAAINTVPMDWVVSYVEKNFTTSVLTEYELDGTNSGSDITLIAGPTAPAKRQFKFLSITNLDDVANTIIIFVDDNGSEREIANYTVEPGDILYYVDTVGFYMLNSAGAPKTTPVVSSTITGATNVGGGAGIYKSILANILQFRTLVAGSSKLTITAGVNTVSLDLAAANMMFNEVPTGAIDNVNAIFGLTNTPTPQSLMQVWKAGLYQQQGVDYNFLTTTQIEFVVGGEPRINDNLVVCYWY